MTWSKTDEKRALDAYQRALSLLHALGDVLNNPTWEPSGSIQQGVMQEAFSFCRLMAIRDHVLFERHQKKKTAAARRIKSGSDWG